MNDWLDYRILEMEEMAWNCLAYLENDRFYYKGEWAYGCFHDRYSKHYDKELLEILESEGV